MTEEIDYSIFDFSDVNEVDDDWTAERVRRFAEWFGYQITENPEASSGYSVISPSGAHLGGFAANSIIGAWQKNPTGQKGGDKKGKGKAGVGKAAEPSAAEKKAAADAKKAETAKAALDSAKANAALSMSTVNPEALERNSGGKLDKGDINDLVANAKAALDKAATPKEVTQALKEFRTAMTQYKTQATMKPPADQVMANTISKLKGSLPDATVLAGTSFDENRIQKVIDKHTKLLESAQTPAEAQQAIKDMRTAISEDKIAQAKEKAEKAKEEKAQKDILKKTATGAKQTHVAVKKTSASAYLPPPSTPSGAPATSAPGAGPVSAPGVKAYGEDGPKTAAEWADYYSREWYGIGEPMQFASGGNHNPAGHNQWSNGHVGGAVREIGTIAEGKAFLDGHYSGWRKSLTPNEDKGLAFYQSPGYVLMNGQLRGTALNAPAADLVRASAATKALNSAIKKAPPLEQPLAVHRGFSAEQFGKLEVGKIVQDKGFVSTSVSKEGAGSYSAIGAQAHAVVKLPAGTRAAAGGFKELILPPGAKFKVNSVKQVGKITHVEMELVA